MNSNKNQHLRSPGQDILRNASTGEHDTTQIWSHPESGGPVTIAMLSEVLFKKQSGSAMSPGPAFSFVKALQAVNSKLGELYPESEELFKVILTDVSSSDSLEKVIKEHRLEELITLLSVSEDQLVNELQQNNTHLYLADELGLKVQEVVNAGIAAAVVFTPKKNIIPVSEDQLHVAFDGDAVLFSNESELVFQRDGLHGYLEHEKQNVENPMNKGPFKGFLEVLIKLQQKLHNKDLYENCPIRTYLVTSRAAGCGGYRALKTLHTWGLELDEAVLLAGSKKGPTLEKIRPHIFFDDQKRHVDAALEVGTVAGLVPHQNNNKCNR